MALHVNDPTPDYVSVRRVTNQQIDTLWMRTKGKFPKRDFRIQQARAMLNNELRAPMPKKFEQKVKDGNLLQTRLPQGTTVPLKTVNVMQRRQPRIRRQAVGFGQQALEDNTKIEKWLNAVLLQLFKWRDAVDYLFNEGEVCMIVAPTDAGWQQVPSLMEALDDEGEVRERIRPIYSRDKKGRKPSHSYYRNDKKRVYAEDRDASTSAYEDALDDFMARHLPWTVRIVPATDTAPIWNGDRLEGVLVRTQYSKNELIRRNFVWDGMHEAVSPVDEDDDDSVSAGGAGFTLTEAWLLDEVGRPYVAYSINGQRTSWRPQSEDEEAQPAIIDLYTDYGLTELPVTYEYGWHFASKNPDRRGVPFIYPFIPSLLSVDALSMATVVHAWWGAFGGMGYTPDPRIDPRAWLHEGQPRTFDLEPMTVQALPGPMAPLQAANVGQDVYQMITLMLGATEKEQPSGAAFGAGGATSGHDRSLMRDYLEDAIGQVLLAGRQMMAFAGKMILMMACHLMDSEQVDLPVYTNVRPGPQANKNTPEKRELIRLEPGDIGLAYDVEAFYPRQPGENMALAQQLAEFVKQELGTFDEFREWGFGDENPEETRIAIAVDKMLFQSELGQQYIMELAVDYLGDTKMKEMLLLQKQAKMTPAGTPTAMLEGLFPGGSPGGNPGNVMTGMGSGGSVRGQLGGIVSQGLGGGPARSDAVQRAAAASGAENL